MKLAQIFQPCIIEIINIESSKYQHSLINMGLHKHTTIYIESRYDNKRYVSFLLSGVEYVLKRNVAESIEVKIK